MSRKPQNVTISTKTGFVIIACVGLPLAAIALFGFIAPQLSYSIAYNLGFYRDSKPEPSCQRAALNMKTGSKLYLDGECRTAIATVLGENKNHPFPGGNARGVKVEYLDGSQEWKRYDDIGDRAYVDSADSNLGELRQLQD